MYPYRMYFVVAVEFCERFSFSSLRSILSFYIRDVLLYDERQAIDIYHVFLMLCYVSAIFGGIVANSDYGKYKSILSSSIVYWIGVLLLFWTTIQEHNTSKNFVVLYSLILVSIGTGCVKACIATFGVDQLMGNDQNINSTNVRIFFSTFYFAIHLGVFFGLLASPTITKIMLYEGHDVNMYTVTFGLPIIMMTIAISVFVCGHPYYSFRKPAPNVIPKMIKCIFFISLKQLTSYYKKPKGKHQLIDYANDAFSENFINDTKKTLYMLRLYIPLSIFWSLFDQQNTTWMFQAAYTSERLFGIKFPVCLLQVVNPLLVLFTIPFMNRILYPYLEKHKLFKHPLKRMLLGGSIAGISFVFAGCIELYLEKNPQNVNVTNINLCAYENPSSVCLWSSNSGVRELNRNEYFVVNDIDKSMRETSAEIRIVTCVDGDSERKTINGEEIIKTRLKKNKMPIVLLLVVTGTGNNSFNDRASLTNSSAVLVPENACTTPEESIYIIFPENNRDNWSRIENLTLESASTKKITVYEKNRKRTIPDIPLGLYTLTINYMDENRRPKSRIVLNVETDKMYTYTRSHRNETNSTSFRSNTVSQSHVLSKEWLLPQFVFMAFGETLFTMTGLAFSFSEAPETIKTVSISMWYFSVALGNLIVIIVHKIAVFEKKSNMFFTFAFNALLTIVVTYKLSNDFEKLYVEKESSDTENVDLVILLKKESYQLAF